MENVPQEVKAQIEKALDKRQVDSMIDKLALILDPLVFNGQLSEEDFEYILRQMRKK